MLNQSTIDEIAQKAASANLSSSTISRVMSEVTIDSEGRDALRITIVVRPEAVGNLTGDSTLDTLVQIQSDLRDAGEERLPIVEYATEKELQESGDT